MLLRRIDWSIFTNGIQSILPAREATTFIFTVGWKSCRTNMLWDAGKSHHQAQNQDKLMQVPKEKKKRTYFAMAFPSTSKSRFSIQHKLIEQLMTPLAIPLAPKQGHNWFGEIRSAVHIQCALGRLPVWTSESEVYLCGTFSGSTE